MAEIDLSQVQVRVRTPEHAEDCHRQVLHGVRTTLEGLVAGVDDHAGRIASDVEVDLDPVHRGDSDARQGLQTICQVTVCHEQVGDRPTRLAPLSRVHPR